MHVCFQSLGPREEVLRYFESLGYSCPSNVDLSDFLQVVPTPEGRRYRTVAVEKDFIHSTESLVAAWKSSTLFTKMCAAMYSSLPIGHTHTSMHNETVLDTLESGYPTTISNFATTNKDVITTATTSTTATVWYEDLRKRIHGSWWFHFNLTFRRQFRLMIRNTTYIKGRLAVDLILAGVAGSLFSSIESIDVATMNGFIYFVVLNCALTDFSIMSEIFNQKLIHFRHSAALFYPTSCLTISQNMVVAPFIAVETIVFGAVM